MLLATVVLQELWAAVRNPREARDRDFSSARLRVLRNEVLLAATAYLHDANVLTENTRDFAAIAEVISVRWESA